MKRLSFWWELRVRERKCDKYDSHKHRAFGIFEDVFPNIRSYCRLKFFAFRIKSVFEGIYEALTLVQI